MQMRRADFAGSWYPADPVQCREQIESFVSDGPVAIEEGILGVGGIAPHAGWAFSGRIAARVVSAMAHCGSADVIAIFGMHLGQGHPHFIMTDGLWETPLGPLEVASEAAIQLSRGFNFQIETPSRHVRDNTIELLLPFVKYFFPKAKIIPIGPAPGSQAAAIGQALIDITKSQGVSLKVIGSTDLTHYGPNYGFSPAGTGADALKWSKENDKAQIEKILALDSDGVIAQGLTRHNACCSGAVAATVAAARALGATRGQLLDYATSHDKSPGSSFVGYVGTLF
ncbi:MAG: AmmeMemoRadiSam system protein B [Desulfatibacillaceae bacterium]|nr:AmmeMemoRadiSam system protein B [Desulfatibacillaceae bacterium]